MNPGVDAANPTLVDAFRSALMHQSVIVAAIVIALMLAYWVARRLLSAAAPPGPPRPAADPEHRARRLLRIGFGSLWIIDGILQAQPKMAGGLVSQVIAPTATASPTWVQDLANFGSTIWSFHPVQAAAATVWIQAGIGVWLIVADKGWWSRVAGLASVAWGLIVWVFGEAFGGIFAPGLSWLTGAPGAVTIYITAGVLIALPARAWAGPRLGRLVLAGVGLCWGALAVVQAWPGRGYWEGRGGTLTMMVNSMSQITQPREQSLMVNSFASFNRVYGVPDNLAVVILLGLLSLAFLSGRPRLLKIAVPVAAVLCLADWVLVQDFGVPGGLGTDPNSMVPWALLVSGGYLALTAPWTQEEAASADAARLLQVRARLSLDRVRAVLRPAEIRQAVASASARSLTSFGAVAVVLLGAAPLASATVNQHADPIIARAVAGGSLATDLPAPGFQLVSQAGRPVSLASLQGKVVVLTFLDPTCMGCPVIGQELKAADTLLGGARNDAEIVAVAADTMHASPVFLRAFDRREGLTSVPNWLYLSGTLGQLGQVWAQYERVAPNMMTGMSARSDVAFIIDREGRIRQEIKDNPGIGSLSTRSSFAVLISDAVRQTLALP